jgi:hypothetical protein
VLGTGIGALIDAARKKNNIIKTSEMEPPVSDRTAALLGLRGPVLMGRNDIKPALRELAARSEKITEFALVRDANGQLVESDNGGSGFKTAAKVGLGAAGAAGAAVSGTRGYHFYNAVKAAGKGSFRKGVSNAVNYNAFRGDGAAEKIIGAAAQKSARAGWMGKLGKVGNFLTKF